jgi:hypothetical protein
MERLINVKKSNIYMQLNTPTLNQASPVGGDAIVASSKDMLYLNHLLLTLQAAQQTFITKDFETFSLYCTYLQSAVLSEDVRNLIEKKYNVLADNYKKNHPNTEKGDPMLNFLMGFVVIQEVFAYINQRFELETEDVMGDIGELDMVGE